MQQLAGHLAQAQALLHQEIQTAMAQQRPLRLPTDPLLGPIYQELQGKIVSSPAGSRSRSQQLFPFGEGAGR